MNASGMIECNDDSSVQIVRTNETANLNGSSHNAGSLINFSVTKVSFHRLCINGT